MRLQLVVAFGVLMFGIPLASAKDPGQPASLKLHPDLGKHYFEGFRAIDEHGRAIRLILADLHKLRAHPNGTFTVDYGFTKSSSTRYELKELAIVVGRYYKPLVLGPNLFTIPVDEARRMVGESVDRAILEMRREDDKLGREPPPRGFTEMERLSGPVTVRLD